MGVGGQATHGLSTTLKVFIQSAETQTISTRDREMQGRIHKSLDGVSCSPLGWSKPALEYSDTRFSKKLVLPWSDIMSMKSKGFVALYSLTLPRETKSLSATNSMYWLMREAFMPIRPTGRASTRQLMMSRG